MKYLTHHPIHYWIGIAIFFLFFPSTAIAQCLKIRVFLQEYISR